MTGGRGVAPFTPENPTKQTYPLNETTASDGKQSGNHHLKKFMNELHTIHCKLITHSPYTSTTFEFYQPKQPQCTAFTRKTSWNLSICVQDSWLTQCCVSNWIQSNDNKTQFHLGRPACITSISIPEWLLHKSAIQKSNRSAGSHPPSSNIDTAKANTDIIGWWLVWLHLWWHFIFRKVKKEQWYFF